MIETKVISTTDLIFDSQFKNWLKKGQPIHSKFSNLGEEVLQEAIEIIMAFDSRKQGFSKQQINDKYTDLMSKIKAL